MADAHHYLRPIPLEVLKSWPKPNYVNPVRRGPALLIVNAILLPITTAVIIGRLYARLKIVRSAGLDDLFIALAYIPTVGLTICVCLGSTIVTIVEYLVLEVSFATQFLFLWAANLAKISILLFYRRMSTAATKRGLRYAVWITIAIVVCFHFSALIGLIMGCTPVRATWDISTPGAHCIDQSAFKMAVGVINTITDFVIILIPLPTVWGLQLRIKQKIALTCIFLAGLLVCIAGLVRTYYVHVLTSVTYDLTWEGFTMWIYIAIEIDLSIICASAPALKPLFKHYLDTTFSGFSRKAPISDPESDNSGDVQAQKSVELHHVKRPNEGGMTMFSQDSKECLFVVQKPVSVAV
ncbi:hypothetical protein FGG08_000507 [Glutinoglossum americanum]|uniref:Rhodopsin domain-containing protein n=1 Tax=Glutinoglossum americanum TaxID=1670608 RepID=A0A9P8L3N9_9PEZI|nr:hypothetical protein FGG08_000507 [Glutinoglossum americanum]